MARNCQAIARQTGKPSIPAKVVYPLLHALEKDGCLRARPQEAAGRTRIYYTLTSKGVRRSRPHRRMDESGKGRWGWC